MANDSFIKELSEELCPEYIRKNVCIEGDKNGFNSKIAIDKFKTRIKEGNLNLEELQKKYIKVNYKIEIINNDINKIIIKVSEIVSDNKKLLKEKIKLLTKHRTNNYNKIKTDDNITDEILKEYTKLKKISKIPVPEPNEIFSNPEQYRPILNMVLNSKMLDQSKMNHPYIKYFKLIAEKLNIQPLKIDKLPLIKNKLSKNDDDTDEED